MQLAADRSSDVVVVVVAHVPQHGLESFRRYERAVLSLLRRHEGELQRRLRSEDGEIEVHLVSFPTPEALSGYLADPGRDEHRDLLKASAARLEVFELRDASIEDLVSAY
ncbi:MAG: hypothetical protein M3296_01450 [Actinomycetota bacterium]|nr:hypothetical protein [Actinomycetota bacterium]